MGLDITIIRCDVAKCPHCGKPIKEIIRDQIDSYGYAWREYLEGIGYYVPYEICKKEPERDFYGKDMTLTTEQAKDHPVKTRKSEFLKMFPNAQMVNIERIFCVAHFDSTKVCKENNPSDEKCIACRYRFWNEEISE